MVKKHLILALLLFCFCNGSFAQTQSEMNATAIANYKKSDAQLNKVYKQLMGMLHKSEKPLLVQAEKDWLKFRDSHCKFEASQYEGGSMQPLVYYNCLNQLTKKRIVEIKASIKARDL